MPYNGHTLYYVWEKLQILVLAKGKHNYIYT